jgi:hypothetical protein
MEIRTLLTLAVSYAVNSAPVTDPSSSPSLSAVDNSLLPIFFDDVRSGTLRDRFLTPCPSGVYWQFVENPTKNVNSNESQASPELVDQFKQLGKYFGKVFLSNRQITTGIPLSPAYYRLLLGQPITVDDVKETDPVLWETLKRNRFVIIT